MEEKKRTVNQESKSLDKEGKNINEPKSDKTGPVKKGKGIASWVILLLVNVFMLTASIFFLVSLPKKAAELYKVRSDEERVKESKKIDITGLENIITKENVDKLSGYYPEESGLIDFIELVEEMKKKGSVKNFSLVGQEAVKDKTGAYGIPFIVEFEGSWEKINLSLQEFQNLPYLIRAINIEAETVEENSINFKYGGFLYVSDKLAKTR